MTYAIPNILIVSLLFLAVFTVAEYAYYKKFPVFVTRKMVHIGCGLVTASLPFFVNLNVLIYLCAGFFLLLVWSKRMNLLSSVHKIDDYSVGALIFAPTIALIAIIFWPINLLIFQGAVLVLGLSDGIAGLVGKRYGKRKYCVTGEKSVEGSLAFFLVTLIILSIIAFIGNTPFSLQMFGFIFVSSIIVTIVEGCSGKGWDNLFVPISTALILLYIL